MRINEFSKHLCKDSVTTENMERTEKGWKRPERAKESRERKGEKSHQYAHIPFQFIVRPFSVLAILKRWEPHKKDWKGL